MDVGVPTNSPHVPQFDIELGVPPSTSQNHIVEHQRGITDRLPEMPTRPPYNQYAPSNANSVPEGLKTFWSTQIFRVVMFFLFCFCVLGITTAMTFNKIMSIDQYLGVCSSLLFLLSPSPLDLLKDKKKKIN